jgi:hypothetical protein
MRGTLQKHTNDTIYTTLLEQANVLKKESQTRSYFQRGYKINK